VAMGQCTRWADLRSLLMILIEANMEVMLPGNSTRWQRDRGEEALLQHEAMGRSVLQRDHSHQPSAAQEPRQAPRMQRRRTRKPPRLRVSLQHKLGSLLIWYWVPFLLLDHKWHDLRLWILIENFRYSCRPVQEERIGLGEKARNHHWDCRGISLSAYWVRGEDYTQGHKGQQHTVGWEV